MNIIHDDLSEKSKNFFNKEGIYSIDVYPIDDKLNVIKDFEFVDGYSKVMVTYWTKTINFGHLFQKTYTIINDKFDFPFLGKKYFSFETNIEGIKQFGNNYQLNINSVHEDKKVYITVINDMLKYNGEDHYDLTRTSNPDICLAGKHRLFSFSKNRIITRQYSSIEDIGDNKYLIIDKIKSFKKGYEDYFIFVIDQSDQILSDIYSHLKKEIYVSHDDITNYDEIKIKRQNELDEELKSEFDFKENLIKTYGNKK